MEVIANKTADAILGLKAELDALKKVVLQNRKALDILTAQAGGVCTMINESCCSFVEHTGQFSQTCKKYGIMQKFSMRLQVVLEHLGRTTC